MSNEQRVDDQKVKEHVRERYGARARTTAS